MENSIFMFFGNESSLLKIKIRSWNYLQIIRFAHVHGAKKTVFIDLISEQAKRFWRKHFNAWRQWKQFICYADYVFAIGELVHSVLNNFECQL